MPLCRARGCAIRTLLLPALLGLGLAALAGGSAFAATRSLVDDAGHTVRFAEPPARIVSLVPSLTETICALGACERLVATDDYSNWPAEAAAKPKVGGIQDASVELIARARPQLVLIGRISPLRDRLEGLGIRTFVIYPVAYGDIARTITTLAAILGKDAAGAALRDSIARAVDAAASAYRARTSASPSVYFEVDSSPYAAGPQSFIGELLTRLGARNIVAADLGPFPKLNPEYVVLGNPDVILLAGKPLTPLSSRPGWERIGAIREDRVCTFSPQDIDPVMRPGPRVAQGLQAIAACLSRVAPATR